MKNFIVTFLKPKGSVAKFLVFFGILSLLALGASHHTELIKSYLDTDLLSLKFGDYNITLYEALKALLIAVFVFWTAAIVSDIVEKRINNLHNLRLGNRALVLKILQIFIYFIAFIFTLDVIGIDLTTLTVFSGALGIGIGFGLQKISSNFISGMILLLEKSVEQDDLIELNDGTVGFVRKANARFTLVETFEGKEIMVPNEDFITSRVVNWTYSDKKGRIEISLGVSYNCDIKKAQALILEAACEHPKCIQDPEPKCFLTNFGDSSVDFTLYFWIANVTEGRKEPQSDVLFSIWDKFAANNIEIPFPQRDVHIKSNNAIK